MAATREAMQLAVEHHRAGRLAEAEQLYRQVLRERPGHASALHLLGLVSFQSGDCETAISLIGQAIDADGNQPLFHVNLGAVYERQGRLDQARVCLENALRLNGNLHDVHNTLGKLLAAQGEADEAIACYRRAIEANGQFVEAHENLGALYRARNQWDLALACHRRAAEIDPGDGGAQFHVGLALQNLGQLQQAAVAYEQAARIRPDNAAAHNNLGCVYHALGKPDDAAACYRRALDLCAADATALANLGDVLRELNQSAEARECFDQALRVSPESPQGHYNLALLHLSQGRFDEGWREFAWRLECDDIPKRTFGRPMWRGEPLAGRTLLVHAEQGFGDTLQMLRFVPRLRQRDGNVFVGVPSELVALVKASGYANVLDDEGELPPFKLEVPMLSLPGILHVALDTLGAANPYLRPDPRLVDKWRTRLAGCEAFRIGIHWHGNPRHRTDHFRSIPLDCFRPLAELPGVTLISLQKGVLEGQLREVFAGRSVIDLAGELDDFHDTAAVMKNLDLVITCDSAPAHLAGALGVPVWIAISKIPDWRWMFDRDDSPWYPTARLFRQQTLGDWTDVFARIAAALPAAIDPTSRT